MVNDFEDYEEQDPDVSGRVPPIDLDAEGAVLSAIMLDPSALDKVLEFLKPEHFYSQSHSKIFEAATELRQLGKPIDNVQIGTWLKDRERLRQIGGMAYLTELLTAAPAVGNVIAYATTVHEKWRARSLILACQKFAAEGYVDYGSLQEFLNRAETEISAIARAKESSTVELFSSVLRRTYGKIAESQRRDGIAGIPTGITGYDKLTSGLHDGDLTIVAARSGVGKTSLCMNWVCNIAMSRRNNGAAVFSLEMPREQLAQRILCSESRVDVSKLRNAGLLMSDWKKLTKTASYMGRAPIWIDDFPTLSVLELRAKVKRIQSDFDRKDADGNVTQRLGLVVVDYLQLMKGSQKVKSREQEVASISRDLKALAKELSVPIVALSQLNRAVESRTDKRPQMSDLRESGAIEQDADNVVFIYRDEYYNKDSTERNVAELIVAKQRNGPTGTVRCRFDSEYTRFDNLADGEDVKF